MSRRLTNNNNSSIAFANINQGLCGAADDIFYGSLNLEIANLQMMRKGSLIIVIIIINFG